VHSREACCALSSGFIAVDVVVPVAGRIERIGRAEQGRWRDLLVGAVVHEAEFGVRPDVIIDIHVRQKAGGVAQVIAPVVDVGLGVEYCRRVVAADPRGTN